MTGERPCLRGRNCSKQTYPDVEHIKRCAALVVDDPPEEHKRRDRDERSHSDKRVQPEPPQHSGIDCRYNGHSKCNQHVKNWKLGRTDFDNEQGIADGLRRRVAGDYKKEIAGHEQKASAFCLARPGNILQECARRCHVSPGNWRCEPNALRRRRAWQYFRLPCCAARWWQRLTRATRPQERRSPLRSRSGLTPIEFPSKQLVR